MFSLQKIGTDTEIFLKDNLGKCIPAVGLVGGTKQKPRPIDTLGSAVQEDNVMLEFNVIPAENAEQWVGNINKVLVHVIDEMRAKNLVINIAPSVEFSPDQLMTHQARTMGCEPDFSAWTLEENPTMSASTMRNVRTAGGHIHVSFQVSGANPNRIQMMNLIRMMDLTLGVPSVLLDDDDRRRNFYGRPGAHRIKAEDRVEYRTLSNFWIRNDDLKAWAYNNTVDAIRRLNKIGKWAQENLWGDFLLADITEVIKTNNREKAKKIIKTHDITLP